MLLSPVGPGIGLRRERRARLRGVIAAIVDCLAHFGERVVERLAAFALQQREQRAAVLLQEIGGAFERRGAFVRRRRRPGRKAGRGRRHRRANDRVVALAHDADRAARRSARRQRRSMPPRADAVDERRGLARELRLRRRELRASSASRLARSPNSMPARVSPLRLIEIARQRNLLIARVAAAPAIRLCGRRRISAIGTLRIGGDARRTRSWRRFPEAAAPDKRADRDGRRPARRCGTRHRAVRRAAPRRAPRPCRAGAGTRSPRRRRRPR